jgi:hypothetical protein
VPQDQELEYALYINSTNVEIIEELRPKKDSLQLKHMLKPYKKNILMPFLL